jgi:HK97 family phage major capsid protein
VKSVLFGDFAAGYVVRIVEDLQTLTLTERYADYLQVGHTSFMRAGGTVQNTSAYKALTQA